MSHGAGSALKSPLLAFMTRIFSVDPGFSLKCSKLPASVVRLDGDIVLMLTLFLVSLSVLSVSLSLLVAVSRESPPEFVSPLALVAANNSKHFN